MPEDAAAEFHAKFRLGDLTVCTDQDWTLSVRPAQPVLGALVLSTRHGATSFGDLDERTGTGFVRLVAFAERAARASFGAVRINVLCLMMQDPLVHFHLLPRYAEPVEHSGITWSDPGWPGPPDLGALHVVDDDVLDAIRLTCLSNGSE